MSDDYAEKIIAQMTCFDQHAKPMPRWFLAKREASFALLRRFYREPPPPTIFHYTSSAALISIIANNELWLSDATYLNDRHEIEYGRKLACERVAAAIATETSKEVRAMLEHALGIFERKADPAVYVACFSFADDDLTQWRAYGETVAPIALELQHGPLMFGYTSEGVLDQVVYNEEDQQ